MRDVPRTECADRGWIIAQVSLPRSEEVVDRRRLQDVATAIDFRELDSGRTRSRSSACAVSVGDTPSNATTSASMAIERTWRIGVPVSAPSFSTRAFAVNADLPASDLSLTMRRTASAACTGGATAIASVVAMPRTPGTRDNLAFTTALARIMRRVRGSPYGQTSRLRTPSALVSMNARRGSTCSPISVEKISSELIDVVDLHLQQPPHGGIHRRFPQLARDSFRPVPCSAGWPRCCALRRAASRALP